MTAVKAINRLTTRTIANSLRRSSLMTKMGTRPAVETANATAESQVSKFESGSIATLLFLVDPDHLNRAQRCGAVAAAQFVEVPRVRSPMNRDLEDSLLIRVECNPDPA